jgi:hypothetical protein
MSVGHPGSGSFTVCSSETSSSVKFFQKGYLAPVYLNLRFDAPFVCGDDFIRHQMNRPALLIHAQDPSFGTCWFSRAIDFGDESANPGYWMLQKTDLETWVLSLRRVSGEMATYHVKSKAKLFPITLKQSKANNEFKWPSTITISQGD